MKRKILAFALSLLPAASVTTEAADSAKTGIPNVCLESARIFSWDAPNEQTLIVTDYGKKKYRVTLSGVCTGLDNTKLAIAFVTLSKISCIGPGDRVRYRDQVFGPQQCLVKSVEAYTAPPKGTPSSPDAVKGGQTE